MKTGKRIVYWDSCVFITYLKGEPCWGQEVIDGINETVQDFDSGQCVLATSTLTRVEILQGFLDAEQKKKLKDFFSRRGFFEQNLTPKIADRASSIRDYYANLKPSVKLLTPDSIHLATAILLQVDVLNTLDGAGARTRPINLLRLNGNVAGYNLNICKPTCRPKPITVEPELPLLDGL